MTTSSISSTSSGAISSPGLGSGLDVAGIISKLMQVESQPVTQLQMNEASYQAQLTAYGQLNSAVASFQSAMAAAADLSKYQNVTATGFDSTILSASASSSATGGSHSISVTQLAQSESISTSAANVYQDPNQVIDGGTGGTLTFEFGTYTTNNGTPPTITGFTDNSAKPSKQITISAGQCTLSGIRDAINNANIGVTASLVNDGTGYRMVITSNDSGSNNSLRITGTGVTDFNFDASNMTGSKMVENVAAKDAKLTVDGIQVTKSSNTISDALQGVSLTLKATGSTSINLAQDTAGVTSAITGFVNAYNTLNSTINGLTAYDKTNKQASLLTGDSTTNDILNQVRSTLTSTLTGLNGTYTLLSQIGVSFQKDGTLAVDSTKLNAAMSSNFSAVAGLFANVGTTDNSQLQYVSGTSDTQPGSYAVSISQVATQGAYTGNNIPTGSSTPTPPSAYWSTATTPSTLTLLGNTLSVSVDGVSSSTITLSSMSYSSGADLAAELQAKINGDNAISAAGSSVTVKYDATNSDFVITSNRYGSASNVTVNDQTGLFNGAGAASVIGKDMVATINGNPALCSGQTLTGAAGTAAAGLKIQYTGQQAITANVNYSEGYASKLSTLATNFTSSTGPIQSREDGINASIKDINSQIDDWNNRLAIIQQNYQTQFTALDVMIGQLNQTSSYLTQQLAALPKITG